MQKNPAMKNRIIMQSRYYDYKENKEMLFRVIGEESENEFHVVTVYKTLLERGFKMKIIYDPQTDSLTLIFREMAVKESDEIREGLIVDYGEDDRIVAIEMLDASENIFEPLSFLYEIKGQKAAQKAIA